MEIDKGLTEIKRDIYKYSKDKKHLNRNVHHLLRVFEFRLRKHIQTKINRLPEFNLKVFDEDTQKIKELIKDVEYIKVIIKQFDNENEN